MPHSIPAALQTKLESDAFSIAKLVKLVQPDGGIITITTWDSEIAVNLDGEGVLTYSPVDISEVMRFSAQINAAIDDSQILVPLGDTFPADDIRREFFAGTIIKFGIVSPDDLANPFLHLVYRAGEISINGGAVSFELLGVEKALEQPVGKVLTANCSNDFGDAGCGMNTNVSAWAATTVYALNTEVKPTAGGKLWFYVSTAGTSGGSEPTWTAGTVNDGTVQWTSFDARKVTGTVSSVTDSRTFVATGIDIAADHFGNGMVEWFTGDNTGERQRIGDDDGSGTLTQVKPCLGAFLPGDTFEATAGCWKRKVQDCIGKHDNKNRSSSRTLRFFGFELAPENVTISAPKA